MRPSEEGRDPDHGIFEVLCRRETAFETPHVLKVPGPIWEHPGWVRNTKADYIQVLQIDSVLWGETDPLSVGVFPF